MWPVKSPDFTAAKIAEVCAKGVREPSLAQRVRAEVRTLASNSEEFQKIAKASLCHTITSSQFPVDSISDAEFLWLYSERLVKSVSGKSIYNSLLQNATHGLCSYCQYGIAKTLDHFVPKSFAPTLAIDPWNLIPCCWECNHNLSSSFGTSPDEEFLHPFCLPDLGRWLFAEIQQTNPPTLSFWADPKVGLSPTIRARLIHQFDRLKLAELYPVVAAGDLINISGHAQILAEPSLIEEHLREMALACAVKSVNSRQAVIYEALAESPWFCGEGFRLVL